MMKNAMYESLKICTQPLFNGVDDLRFYVRFNIISVIPGLSADDNQRLHATEPYLRMGRLRLERGSNQGPVNGLMCSIDTLSNE